MNAPDMKEQGGALPPELQDLQGLAAAADANLQAVEVQPAQAGPGLDVQGAEVSAMLQSLVAMATPIAPYLPHAYTPEACERIGVAVAAVAQKYGWDMSKLTSPELMLAIVTIPPTMAAVAMAKAYHAQHHQTEPAREPEATDGG